MRTTGKRIRLSADDVFDYPDDSEVCLTILKSQIGPLVELLEYQRWSTRWYGSVPNNDTLEAWVDGLRDRLLNAEACEPQQCDEGVCLNLNALHPSITYWPNHPLFGSGHIVGPYAETVWTTGAGYILADENDAMVAPLSYLNADIGDLLAYGLPSATFHFTGIGTVRINFIAQIQGGAVWVFPDNNPLLGDFVDLDYREIQDWLSTAALLELLDILAGGITSDVWWEREFTTGGAHTVTAWFIPGLEVEPPYGAAGGGVRGIELCGVGLEAVDMPIDWTLDCNSGVVRLLADGAPHSSIDLSVCGVVGPTGPQGPPGADGADGAPGADGADGADGIDGADAVTERYEIFWNVEGAFPGADWHITWGDWYEDTGVVNETVSSVETIHLTRDVTAHQDVHHIKARIEVLYITEDIVVTIKGGSVVYGSTTIGETGIFEVVLTYDRRASASYYELLIESPNAAFVLSGLWENGKDYPYEGNMIQRTSHYVDTGVPDEMTIPFY